MTAAGVRLACSPRAWTGLLLLAAGCAAPPMAAPPPPVAPGAAIPLRVQPVVRPAGGYQLRAFTPWGAADVATVTA
ncbi:MAG: hypothetical protein VKQ33_06630, partial [Candidatus Sericytochromatia bacterium]|nr:hypothetical protein [Candidatus Sericytochromatia bacterium]